MVADFLLYHPFPAVSRGSQRILGSLSF